jgi:hypothetical protein
MGSDTSTPEPRSRRAILAGAVGGLAAVVASRFASPDRASAAAGAPVIMGAANSAGVTNTSLATTSTGTALLITQNGSGTALRGSAVGTGSIAGFFTATNGTGISGVTGNGGSYGVFAQNNGAAGSAGALRASGGNNSGVIATTANGAKAAVSGINQGSGATAFGVYGQTNADVDGAAGVRGIDAGGGQTTAGVWGTTVSSDGSGIRGTGGVDVATGVWGEAIDGTGVVGESSTGSGVAGYSTDVDTATSVGVEGTTYSTTSGAAGVSGRDNGGTNATSGVRGTTTSTFGSGVLGKADTSGNNAAGVQGKGVGNAMGVWGTTVDTIGVYGLATGNGNGVYGSGATGVSGASTNGYGVYAVNESVLNPALYVSGDAAVTGDLAVTGNLSKGGGSFKIDHPLDPANKFLYHSFVESPDMKNVYDGVVTTDAKGEATVKLPSWFEKLNKDFRYQLTVIGRWSEAWVSSELTGNTFAIATKVPGTKVSWQLTGIRQDAWANAHRVVVEEAKPTGLKGLYLHPKENGQPDSKAIGYTERKAMEAMRPK